MGKSDEPYDAVDLNKLTEGTEPKWDIILRIEEGKRIRERQERRQNLLRLGQIGVYDLLGYGSLAAGLYALASGNKWGAISAGIAFVASNVAKYKSLWRK